MSGNDWWYDDGGSATGRALLAEIKRRAEESHERMKQELARDLYSTDGVPPATYPMRRRWLYWTLWVPVRDYFIRLGLALLGRDAPWYSEE